MVVRIILFLGMWFILVKIRVFMVFVGVSKGMMCLVLGCVWGMLMLMCIFI